MKKTIWQMVGELVLVSVGVFLGIVAGNYNEQRQEHQRQNEFLQRLAVEMKANVQKLQQASAYREKILATSNHLREHLSQDSLRARFWTVGGFTMIEGWQGVQIPTLEKSVYESGLLSNTLSRLDFQTLSAIAQVYAAQQEYKELTRLLITDKLVTLPEQVTTHQVLAELQWWNDVGSVEQDLIRKYHQAIDQVSPK